MPDLPNTHWTVIREAARGDPDAQDRFARWYEPVIRAWLEARWLNSGFRDSVDDGVQDVLVECLRDGGALERTDSRFSGGFRAYLYGIVRNVARRHEERRRRSREWQNGRDSALSEAEALDETPSHALDRAWAMAMVQQARERLEAQARAGGEAAEQRVELLRLRFAEGVPVREIAVLWREDPSRVHRWLRRALEEFRASLREVVREHHPTGPVDAECALILQYLR